MTSYKSYLIKGKRKGKTVYWASHFLPGSIQWSTDAGWAFVVLSLKNIRKYAKSAAESAVTRKVTDIVIEEVTTTSTETYKVIEKVQAHRGNK